jgi:UDP-N-acetylmuramoyl-L-alanyl-D-glutamate--2,6-diaminopimelate ligase
VARSLPLDELVARAQRRGLAASLEASALNASTAVGGVKLDSRRVEPGDLFVAAPGSKADGSAYVEEALARGAVAIATARDAARPLAVPAIVADDVAAAAGYLASAFYDDPSDELDLVGITGTNGKTSSTYLMEAVWKAAGRSPGVVGTIVQRCAAFERGAEMTTPSPVDLQKLLGEMRDAGTDAVAMEASSHALHQSRVAGCRFRAALFSNLTRDHLDYHGTEDAYFAAKASLFRRWLEPGGIAALNADDAKVASLVAELGRHDVWTYSTRPGATARARVVAATCTLAGIEAELDLGGERVRIRSPLVGQPNLSNLVAVAALAAGLGVAPDAIAEGLSACPAVPGRMERVRLDAGGAEVSTDPALNGLPAVFVDYAHTPDALERSLRALAGEVRGRIVVVFGCGGDRDRGKRPIMGRIAAELSGVAVLTSDNPRSEEPLAILAEIEAGIGARMRRARADELAGRDIGGYLVEADRLLAIRTAIGLASADDAVLIAGKGHEDYQETRGVKRHFDDREVARETLAERARSQH